MRLFRVSLIVFALILSRNVVLLSQVEVSKAGLQQNSAAANSEEKGSRSQEPPDPRLRSRPISNGPGALAKTGRLLLDVAVSDSSGKPVLGLQPWDFQVLDNGKPTKIMSFRSFDDDQVRPNPAVEVILLIDELNLSFQQVAFIRSQLSEFLNQNLGRLKYPVSVMLLSDAGLQVQSKPSLDGKSLGSLVEGIPAHVSVINPAMGAGGALDRFQRSLRAMETIAETYARSPGRRLLIWIGPGWPMLESSNFTFTSKDQRRYFDTIVELTNRLREARLVVYSVSPIDSSMGSARFNPARYESYLQAVQTAGQADTGNLALKVIVTHTGGTIFGPSSDLVGQINGCISGANSFYVLTISPPTATQPDEYHALTVKVNRDRVGIRTSAGYYYRP